MAFAVMTTVLAVAFSATRTRPTATDIPLERAQRDEYGPRVSARRDNMGDYQNKNRISGADEYYNNGSHCPHRAPPHTHSHTRLHFSLGMTLHHMGINAVRSTKLSKKHQNETIKLDCTCNEYGALFLPYLLTYLLPFLPLNLKVLFQ